MEFACENYPHLQEKMTDLFILKIRNYDKSNYCVFMASVRNHYGKFNLWQALLMASVTFGKRIMASVVMPNVLWQM